MSWLGIWLAVGVGAAKSPPPGGWPVPPEAARVTSVYDGDTLTLETGDKVRLRSVNTPELRPLQPFGEAARDRARALVLGERVDLRVVPGNARDGYGRVLADVRGPKGDLAETLLREGPAHVFLIPGPEGDPPNLGSLQRAESEAREAGRGIWALPPFRGGLHITSFHANAPGDDRQNVNGEYLRLCNVSGAPLELAGHTLTDRSGAVHVLPALTIPPGHTVRVHSGRGERQADPSETLAVYLGSGVPLWSNAHEVVTLATPSGLRIDRREHGRSR